jgi:hypothetical protein
MSHELFGLNVVIWQFDHLSKPSILRILCWGVWKKTSGTRWGYPLFENVHLCVDDAHNRPW